MATMALTRGDTRTIAIAATLDLTDAFLWFTVKVSPDDPDSEALITKTSDPDGGIVIDAGTGGTGTVTIDPEDWPHPCPQRLVYDLQVRDADGVVTTLDLGTVEVTRDVTVTTAVAS